MLTMGLDIISPKTLLENNPAILNNSMTRIELEALGRIVHAREIQVPEPPFDGSGRTMTILRWDRDSIEQAADYLKPVRDAGNDVLLLAHASPWVTLAIAGCLNPCTCHQFIPRLGITVPFTTILPRGPIDPSTGVFFKVTEKGDLVFIYYEADNPDDRGIHSFDMDTLSRLVLPEVPSGKHVCLYGHGMYIVQTIIAYSYSPGSKSVSTASYEEEEYRCGLSFSGEYHPGDIVADAKPYILRRPFPVTK